MMEAERDGLFEENVSNVRFQEDMEDRSNMSMNFDLDPTIANIGPVEADPTAVEMKTRKARVKLTAEKMLSGKGLPYVMENGRKQFRISKRKSPYENLTCMLRFYQLWAHELFPKAKFKDFVSLCHTLGRADKELREYRTNLVKKDMGILIDNIVDTEMSNISEGLDDRHIGEISSSGLFVADEDRSEEVVVSGRNNNEQEEDDDFLYTTSNTTQSDLNKSRSTQEHVTEKEKEKDDVEEEDEELAMLREMQQLEELERQRDIQSDEELDLMREMDI